MKKVVAAMTSGLFSAVFIFSQMPFANAYYAGQQHTWRFVEKYSGIGLD